MKGIAKAIEARGAELRYLPPYSADLNPIDPSTGSGDVRQGAPEPAEGLKALLRNPAVRSVDKPWNTIGLLLDAFSPLECANYLRHSGYVQPARDALAQPP